MLDANQAVHGKKRAATVRKRKTIFICKISIFFA